MIIIGPLYKKTHAIATAERLPVVCRLGGFHALMSFLGSVGTLMKGSGIEELFEIEYSPPVVTHMLTGKAVYRSLRAHMMTQSALISILLESADVKVYFLKPLYEKALQRVLTQEDIDEVANTSVLDDMYGKLQLQREELEKKSRTAKSWFKYIDYVKIAKDFIAAERISNWELHLESFSKMLNIFAATGHGNYAKCGRVYLQEMRSLPQNHPELYGEFKKGRNSVRRTEKRWAGLWTDLTIEQTLMLDVKSVGGLTGGRGMGDEVRLRWSLSLGCCAFVHRSLMDLTDNAAKTQHHVETRDSRKQVDFEHTTDFYNWLDARNPFLISSQNLHSLSSGIVSISSQDDVNCEQVEQIGERIQKSFDNKSYTDCCIKRLLKHSAQTLAHVEEWGYRAF